MKKFLIILSFIIFSIFLIPLIIMPLSTSTTALKPIIYPETITIDNETIIFDDYILSLVAQEMSPTYNIEAIKAQAVATRGYILDKIQGSPDQYGFQKYISIDNYSKNWESDKRAEYIKKYSLAVSETKGEVLTYNDNIAKTFYHSVSHGNTESSLDIWGVDREYLKSVESDDSRANGYKSKVFYPLEAFNSLLMGARRDIDISNSPKIEKTTYTQGGCVDSITIYNQAFKGTEIADIFKLKSPCFSLYFEDNKAIFEVKGDGHQVGMSKFGANAMAEKGADYKEILAYYYSGTILKSIYHIS